ncbi:MAG: hypothetical protein P8J87_05870, partial [Verrucomicrobiales bacterium]|nr:hypothetical protein [Verrucomicrobiales bacterium]
SWRSGPSQIGFDEGDESTLLTSTEAGADGDRTLAVYFRHRFQLDTPSSIASLQLDLLRDDGAVVYLNGTEIARDNMPSGDIIYSSLASSSVTGASEDRFYTQTFSTDPVSLLVAGENLLAVEVHQRADNSSDLSFDLGLTATNSLPNQAAIATFGGQPFVYWLDPTARLQTSPDLSTWSTDPLATSPQPLAPSALPTQFFRTLSP